MKNNRFGQSEALSKAEFLTVLNSFEEEKHRLILSLCWYTTERPGAILQLQVSHCYKDPGFRIPLPKILIPGDIRKDGRSRELPLHPDLGRELRAYQPPGAGYLFPGRGGSGHLTFSAWYKLLGSKFDALGMRGYSTYSTRRGSITVLARAGLSPKAICEVTGQSINTVQRYIDATESEQDLRTDHEKPSGWTIFGGAPRPQKSSNCVSPAEISQAIAFL